MLSIEIIAIKQTTPVSFEDLPFAVEVNTGLKSNREPSLFQTDFDSLTGCIYHLGESSKKENNAGGFAANDFLSEECINQQELKFIEFKKDILPFIKKIVSSLIESSPSSSVLFTSEYEVSKNTIQRFENIPVKTFFELHDKKEILFNASYKVVK